MAECQCVDMEGMRANKRFFFFTDIRKGATTCMSSFVTIHPVEKAKFNDGQTTGMGQSTRDTNLMQF